MNEAYLSLGSNEGNREQWLQQALALIGNRCGTVIKTSPIYQTAAWGNNDQPDFLNMVLQLQTTMNALQLLNAILDIEISLGRKRTVKWGPRTIDIDILFYNDEVMHVPGLTVPHPFVHERRFILAPLADIAPLYEHPILHKSIAQLLAECKDDLDVHVLKR